MGGRALAVMIAAIVVAFAVRLWHLQFQSLWWDEGVSIYLAGAGIRAMTIGKDFSVDLHAPGYHLLLGVWQSLLGPTVFADRLLSVACGVLTIPLTFSFVRRVAGEAGRSWWAGLVAALLAAVSPIDVYYSQEARMYALLPVLGLVSLYVTDRLLSAGKRRDWILWTAVNCIAWYVYYYLALLTLAEALVLLVVSYRRQQFRVWLVAQCVLVLLYLPWLALVARRFGRSSLALPPETEVYLTPLRYFGENWQDFTLGFTSPPGAVPLLILWGAAAIGGAVILARRRPAAVALLLASCVVPLLGAEAILLARPFYYPRFILFALVPIWTLAALGLTAGGRRWLLPTVLVVPLLAGGGWTTYVERTTPRSGYAPDDYRTVFPTLAANAQPGDVILCGYPWEAGYVEAYIAGSGLRAVFMPQPVAPEAVAQVVGPSGRIWVYGYSPDHHFVGDPFEQILAPRAQTLVVDQYGDARVRLFGPAPVPAPHPPLLPLRVVTFGGEIALLGAAVPSGVVHPGDTIRATLRWGALGNPGGSYTVFVHLLGPDGKVWGQLDSPPVGGAFPTQTWRFGEVVVDRYAFAVDPGAPPGRYEVEVGMYHPENGQRLKVGPTPQQDDRIVLGTLTVSRGS